MEATPVNRRGSAGIEFPVYALMIGFELVAHLLSARRWRFFDPDHPAVREIAGSTALMLQERWGRRGISWRECGNRQVVVTLADERIARSVRLTVGVSSRWRAPRPEVIGWATYPEREPSSCTRAIPQKPSKSLNLLLKLGVGDSPITSQGFPRTDRKLQDSSAAGSVSV
jgi:hypothetical protein